MTCSNPPRPLELRLQRVPVVLVVLEVQVGLARVLDRGEIGSGDPEPERADAAAAETEVARPETARLTVDRLAEVDLVAGQ